MIPTLTAILIAGLVGRCLIDTIPDHWIRCFPMKAFLASATTLAAFLFCITLAIPDASEPRSGAPFTLTGR